MILNGWNEIAKYIRCGVRTAQRWEVKGLPISRPIPGLRAHVVAYPQQLDSWLKRSNDRPSGMAKAQTDIEHTQQLLATLSQERRLLRLRIDKLHRHLAKLRAMHPKRRKVVEG